MSYPDPSALDLEAVWVFMLKNAYLSKYEAVQEFILIFFFFLILRFLKLEMEKGVFLFYWFGFYSCF